MMRPGEDSEMLMLERARRGLAPNASERKAALGRLAVALALPPAVNPLAPESPGLAPLAPAAVSLNGAASVSVYTLLAGIAGGLAVGFGAGHFSARPSVEPPTEVRSSAPVMTSVRAPAPAEPALAPQPTVAEPAATTKPPASASLPKRPNRDPERADSAPSADYDELSYVQRAQTALRNGDAALALGLVRTLDERQPKGALLAERTVLRVLALCELGRADEARAATLATLGNGAGNEVYRRRIESSCVGKAAKPSGE